MEKNVKLTAIPAKVRKMYGIERVKKGSGGSKYEYIAIHEPSFINIATENIEITKDKTVVNLYNKKVWVTLWIQNRILHVTVL